MFARLFLLFVTVPLLELFLFLVAGQRIGIPATFAAIFLTGILGAALARSQGLRTLAKYRESISQGLIPHEAILDGFMILVAGTLLLTPGFLTDAIGFFLLAPAFRAMVRRRVEASLQERFKATEGAGFGGAPGGGSRGGKGGADITVDAEVIESRVYRDDTIPRA
jgi:UPF0716 protein FxsA